MAIPKSKKLEAQLQEATPSIPTFAAPKETSPTGPVKIRPVQCCNDFVAIMQSQIETSIAMADSDSTYKNEGIVVGVGPGLPVGDGTRCKPLIEIGDLVMFGARNIAAVVESASPPYDGKKIVIVSERNILCKLQKKYDFVIV